LLIAIVVAVVVDSRIFKEEKLSVLEALLSLTSAERTGDTIAYIFH